MLNNCEPPPRRIIAHRAHRTLHRTTKAGKEKTFFFLFYFLKNISHPASPL
jgi:hypothetical protein